MAGLPLFIHVLLAFTALRDVAINVFQVPVRYCSSKETKLISISRLRGLNELGLYWEGGGGETLASRVGANGGQHKSFLKI